MASSGALQIERMDVPANYFLTIDGVTGSSLDKAHAGAIEISSFIFGVEMSVSISSATGGAGAGKASFRAMHVSAPSSAAGPQLLVMCASGQHAKSATLATRGAAPGAPGDFLLATFGLVAVQSYQLSGDSGGEGPVDEFTLLYGALHVDYRPQSQSGAPGAPISGGWDVTKNQKI